MSAPCQIRWSRTFYRDAARPNPTPLRRKSGKFVILTKGKGVHLMLSPVSLTPYHANIVYQYLQVGRPRRSGSRQQQRMPDPLRKAGPCMEAGITPCSIGCTI